MESLLIWLLATIAMRISLWLYARLRLARKNWLGAPTAWYYAATIGCAVKWCLDFQIESEVPFFLCAMFLITNIGVILNIFVMFQNRGKMPVLVSDNKARKWIIQNLAGKKGALEDTFLNASAFVSALNEINRNAGTNEYYELLVAPSRRHTGMLLDTRYPALADVIPQKYAYASIGDCFIFIGFVIGAATLASLSISLLIL